LNNFSIQSSYLFHSKIESDNNGFLAAKSFIWQNRFFMITPSSIFQLFSELGTRFFWRKEKKVLQTIV
jgi:hypothetical protein